MKRLFAFLLAACLLLTLAGCRRKTDTPPSETDATEAVSTENTSDAPTEALSTEPQIPVVHRPMISISVPAVTETTEAEDGTVIFQYIYQNISLTCPEPEIADKIILDLMNRIDSTNATAEEILASAEAAYTGGSWTPYLCRVIYDPMRIDSGVLSFFGSNIQYSGTPHPQHTYPSVSYDMVTGEVLTLPGILAIDNAGDALCEYVLEALAEVKDEKYLYEDYVTTVTKRLTGDLSRENCWYFTPTGLCFYFLPYEIAPYSSGVVTAEVPYELLPGVIADAYFPPEQEDATGSVIAEPFDLDTLEKFSQFPEVVLEAGGDKLLLHTNGTVSHVRLEVGGPSYGGSFAPDYVAFASNTLSAGDALLVEADFPEDTPRFRLIYTSSQAQISLLLTKDAEGNFQLIEE